MLEGLCQSIRKRNNCKHPPRLSGQALSLSLWMGKDTCRQHRRVLTVRTVPPAPPLSRQSLGPSLWMGKDTCKQHGRNSTVRTVPECPWHLLLRNLSVSALISQEHSCRQQGRVLTFCLIPAGPSHLQTNFEPLTLE